MASSPLFNRNLVRGCILASIISIATVVYVIVDTIQSECAIVKNELSYISMVISSIKKEKLPHLINELLPKSLFVQSGYKVTLYKKTNIVYSNDSPLGDMYHFVKATVEIFGLKHEVTEDINNDYMIAISGVYGQITAHRFLTPAAAITVLTPFLSLLISLYMVACNRKLPHSLSRLTKKIFEKDVDTVLTSSSVLESSFIDLEKRMTERHNQSESELHKQISELTVRLVNEENAKEEKIALLNHVITSTTSLASSQYKLLSNLKVMVSNVRSRMTNKEDQISIIEVERMISSAITNNHRITEPHMMLTKVFEPTAADMIHISDEIMLSLNTISILYSDVSIVYEEDPNIPSELFINSSLFRDVILGLVQIEVSTPHSNSIYVRTWFNIDGDGSLQVSVTSHSLYAVDQDQDIDTDTIIYLHESLESIGGNLHSQISHDHATRERMATIPAISTGNPSSLYRSSIMKMSGSYSPILVVGSEKKSSLAVCNKLQKLSCNFFTVSTQDAESNAYNADIAIIINGSLHDRAVTNLKHTCKIVISLEKQNYEKALRYIQSAKNIDIALPFNVTYTRLATNIIEARASTSSVIGCTAINHESNVTALLSRMSNKTSLAVVGNNEQSSSPSMLINSLISKKNILVYGTNDELMNSVLSTLRAIEVKYTSVKDVNTLYSHTFREVFDYVFICMTESSAKEMDTITKIRWSCHSKDVKFYLIGSDVSQIKDIEFINMFQSIMMFPVSAENIIAQLHL